MKFPAGQPSGQNARPSTPLDQPIAALFPHEISLDLDAVHGLSADALGHTARPKRLHHHRSMHQLGVPLPPDVSFLRTPSPSHTPTHAYHDPSHPGDTDRLALDRLTFQMQREEQVLHRMLEGLQGWVHLTGECKRASDCDRPVKFAALQAGYRQHLMQCNDLYRSLLQEEWMAVPQTSMPQVDSPGEEEHPHDPPRASSKRATTPLDQEMAVDTTYYRPALPMSPSVAEETEAAIVYATYQSWLSHQYAPAPPNQNIMSLLSHVAQEEKARPSAIPLFGPNRTTSLAATRSAPTSPLSARAPPSFNVSPKDVSSPIEMASLASKKRQRMSVEDLQVHTAVLTAIIDDDDRLEAYYGLPYYQDGTSVCEQAEPQTTVGAAIGGIFPAARIDSPFSRSRTLAINELKSSEAGQHAYISSAYTYHVAKTNAIHFEVNLRVIKLDEEGHPSPTGTRLATLLRVIPTDPVPHESNDVDAKSFTDSIMSVISHEFGTPLIEIQHALSEISVATQEDIAALESLMSSIEENIDRLVTSVSQSVTHLPQDHRTIGSLREAIAQVKRRYATAIQRSRTDYTEASSRVDNFRGRVRELVEYGTIANDGLLLNSTCFDSLRFVRDLHLRFHALAKAQKHVHLKTCIHPCRRNPFICTDEQRLRQVLTSILANAIQHSKQGADAILFTMRLTPQHIHFTVQDHGEGMDKDQLAHVRQAFARYKSTLKETSVGLGLFIADAIVKAMQGELHMTSTKGQGTTVHITVPYVCGINETLSRAYHPITKEEETLDDLMVMEDEEMDASSESIHETAMTPVRRILLAEDNVINMKMLTRALQQCGYSDVDQAQDGVEAMELWQARRADYSVVLLDAYMPRMNGIEVAEQIRRDDPQMPLVCVSANTDQNSRRLALTAGVNLYLEKPISSRQMTEAFTQLGLRPLY